MRQDAGALTGLVHVLRNLIEERVPVFALRRIVETFLDLRARCTHRISTFMKAVRLLPDVRRHLPGNEPPTSYFCLPHAIENEIARSIATVDGVHFLVVDPAGHSTGPLPMVRSWLELAERTRPRWWCATHRSGDSPAGWSIWSFRPHGPLSR